MIPSNENSEQLKGISMTICQFTGSAERFTRDGSTTSLERNQYIAHLATCESCREEEQHVRVIQLWRKYRQELPPFLYGEGPGESQSQLYVKNL